MKYGLDDFRNDTPRDVVDRFVPRVTVSLLGMFLTYSSIAFAQPDAAFWSSCVTGVVLFFLGINGLWLPHVRKVQLAAALWIPVACLVFRVRGGALWAALAVSAGVALVTLLEYWRFSRRSR